MLPLDTQTAPKGGIKQKMKIFRSRKALSPVVASIILIAVTVAVSIAVAAWMGALTLNFTKTENIILPDSSALVWITNGTSTTSGSNVTITIRNGATTLVTVTTVKVNGNAVGTSDTWPETSFSIQPNAQQTVELYMQLGWSAGSKYRIDFVTSNNNDFYQEYTAPSS
jgi:flagellin-like protein